MTIRRRPPTDHPGGEDDEGDEERKVEVMTPAEARAALAQASVEALAGVLAYAEGVALVVGGVGVAVEPPEEIVRRAVDDTVDQRAPWLPRLGTFPVHLRRVVRLRIGEHLLRHARIKGGTGDPWQAHLGKVQLGDLRGVEQLAHYTGEMAPSFRECDPRVHEAAHRLHDFVRSRLEPWAADGADARAPSVRAAAPATAVIDVAVGGRGDEPLN